MKKVQPQPLKPQINWDQKQWVRSKTFSDMFVLTTGAHEDVKFAGTCLPCNQYPEGKYNINWNKDNFDYHEGEVSFLISNKD